MTLSDRLKLVQVSLIIVFLFGVLGSAAETSAFSLPPVANPARAHSTASINNANTQPGKDVFHTTVYATPNVEEEATQNKEEDEEPESEVAKRLSSKQILPTVGLSTLVVVSLAAKLGVLGDYTNAMIAQDTGMAIFSGTLGYIFVKGNTWLAGKGYLEPRDSRKIIHTLSAPLFILLWPLFSPAEGARYFAASVSFVNMVRLYIAGSGGDKSLAYAVSRSGEQSEALGGPFLYVNILLFTILLFWRDSPVGIVALSAMAAGDGLADLLGRRYGKNNKWWFNTDKSIAGSVAFWVGSTACAAVSLNILSIQLSSSLLPGNPYGILGAIMLIAALLEVIPGPFDDNWVVPVSAAALALAAFS